MPVLQLGPQDGLYYEYDPPTAEGGCTFVFVNAITGDAGMWQAEVGPALREAGHGTLAYNFRGQANSPYAPDLKLTAEVIYGDLGRLVGELAPPKPVLVGLSIGGLYCCRAFLAGCPAAGLVLVNTLREIGPRIAWINDAALMAMQVGGPNLMRDMMTPLLFGPAYLEAHRHECLQPDTAYEPLDPDSGAINLLTWMGKTDWVVPYDQLTCPVLVMMGPNDRVFYDPAIVDRLFAQLPDGRRVDVPEAGHMLPVEAPQPFVAALKDFGASL